VEQSSTIGFLANDLLEVCQRESLLEGEALCGDFAEWIDDQNQQEKDRHAQDQWTDPQALSQVSHSTSTPEISFQFLSVATF
jgi:hypothetical protein